MNTKWYGYQGRVLDVDLTTGRIITSALSRDMAESYLGGKGFGARVIFDQVPAGCDPLSPENILVFATGPLTGTLTPTSGRMEVCTKSPLTGLWLDSNCGGSFGPEIKLAGYDHLIIRGRASEPSLLVIEDDAVSILSALEIWGLNTFETHDWVRKIYGSTAKSACIGTAGEKCVLLACIMSEQRSFGRGGAGAVMGSKNLKAIVAKGTGEIAVHDRESFMRLCRESFNEVYNSPDTGGMRPRYGTNAIISLMDMAGIHPVRNFQNNVFRGAEDIDEDTIAELFDRNRACFNCPIYCSKIASVKKGKYKGAVTEGPEYENTWAFGAQCDNTDLGAIVKAEYLCDLYGLDAISCGVVIGFLMECNEKVLGADTDVDLTLKFGSDDDIIKAIHLIGAREGSGEFWGQGVRCLSKMIPGSRQFAIHVKGMELPAYDPRGSTGMALAYATSDRGGCHLRSWPIGAEFMNTDQRMDPQSTEFKAEYVKSEQDLHAIINCLGICLFAVSSVGIRQLTPLLHAVCGLKGLEMTENLLEIGERVNNLTRLFNIREGLTMADDSLPERFESPVVDGPLKGATADISQMLKDYYMLRGWDVEGVPTEKKLMELGLLKESQDV
jgi:aldehyde:ferredoxin oxidoreductase